MGLVSWWRGRAGASDGAVDGAADGSEGSTSGAAEDTSAVDGPGPVREAPAWPQLPPLQRTLSGAALTIDPTGFQGTLTTRRDSTLGTPLGHLVDPAAPTGLAHGIAESAAGGGAATGGATSSDGSESPGASVAGTGSGGAAAPTVLRAVAFPAPPAPVDMPMPRAIPLRRATPESMVAAAHVDAGPSWHVPHAPVPEGGFDVPPRGHGDLPDGGDAIGSGPSVQAASAGRDGTGLPGLPGPGHVDAGTSPRPPSAADAAVAVDPPADRTPPGMPVQRGRGAGGTGSMTFRPGPHTGPGATLGLGAPLSELPQTAQRSAAARTGPEAPAPGADAAPYPVGPLGVADAGAAVGGSADPPVAPLLGGAAPLSGGSGDAEGSGTDSAQRAVDPTSARGDAGRLGLASPDSGGSGRSAAGMPTAPGGAARGAVAASPGSGGHLQRSMGLPAARGAASGPGASASSSGPHAIAGAEPGASAFAFPAPLLPPVSPLPVAQLLAWRSLPLYSGAEVPSSVGVGQSGSVTQPADDAGPRAVPVRWEPAETALRASVQRTAAEGAAWDGKRGGSSGAPVVGPALDATAPGTTLQRSAATARPTAGDTALAAGLGHRAADGSVVFDLPLQRAEEGETGIEPDPVSDQVTPDQPTSTAIPTTPGEPAEPTEQPTEQQPPPQGPDPDKPPAVTDDLVRALYTPLSRMLRADLRLERERAGFLIDTRH
ncbi:hypothetical protein GCM10023205_59460 [Yinghuangia aomiensis]|uniref:Syndecan 1 n=1 Tax=Yinghuangia aomiensis TaxID=676205 RepID=A0ABP9HZ08_9ACTN